MMMKAKWTALKGKSVTLWDHELLRRRQDNRDYMMRLKNQNLLQNFTHEAGICDIFGSEELDQIHGGWESPLCQLRGHFLGHWLSAAAMNVQATGDQELKAKADAIVHVLAQCQEENGGEWVGSIPEKYLDWIAKGKGVWAPHYTLHKTLMGLLDMYEMTGNEEALGIAVNFAKWFDRWSAKFTREEFDNILDVETGGMLEVWVQLYNITKDPTHKNLIDRYYRGRLFDALLRGEDVLTNMHANTTIPEVLGAALAYEVTGEEKWKQIVEAYWKFAVDERGFYATGGQTCGEIWTPKFELGARLGDKDQEHCAVYNMMRLAEFLFRWTGEARYADYWERNLYNGVMAQTYWDGHNRFTHGLKSDQPLTGLLTYFLPLRGGAHKAWASETKDFFCCHGSMVQANAAFNQTIYYQSDDALAVCQYFNSDLHTTVQGTDVTILQRIDTQVGNDYTTSVSVGTQRITDVTRKVQHDPNSVTDHLFIRSAEPVEFTLKIRKPWWVQGEPKLVVNGEAQPLCVDEQGFLSVCRTWQDDEVFFEFQKAITACPLPDEPEMVAFMNGPVVLAGFCDEERAIYAPDPNHPETLVVPDNEREWANWKQTFKLKGQDRGIRLFPLYQVGYEAYSVYFPVYPK